ncbi:MAG TPA: type II toxin-antitoxin system RelE/ParE family toxin [Longimicrobium sp.]|nr:type II toxin-antitoxin system RelE/ParE family toxin [Longimicrobium sp.]
MKGSLTTPLAYNMLPDDLHRTPCVQPSARRVSRRRELPRFADCSAGKPEAGAEIKGTGGLRKLRWAVEGHGKRGGVRVIYIPLRVRAVILLLFVYQKNEQEDLTAEQKKVLRVLVEREILGIQGEP